MSRTELIVGKLNHLQLTLTYLRSRICSIVHHDGSNSLSSQCNCHMYWVVFPWHLAPFSRQGDLQPGAEEKVTGCSVRWVREMGNHWNAMLGQEFPHIQGHWAWHIAEVQKAGTPKAICEAVQQTAPPRHSRKVLQIVKVIGIGKIFDQFCFTFFGQSNEGIFQSNVFYWFSTFSPNAWCSISYLLVVVLCSFQQNLKQKHCSFSTLISQCDVGKITCCRLLHLWWSQPATCSLVCGIRRCCHFSNISSLAIKITFCPRYFWSSWMFGEDCYFRKPPLHNWSILFFTLCRSIFWHYNIHEYSLVLIL
jgi:hypothetical protein